METELTIDGMLAFDIERGYRKYHGELVYCHAFDLTHDRVARLKRSRNIGRKVYRLGYGLEPYQFDQRVDDEPLPEWVYSRDEEPAPKTPLPTDRQARKDIPIATGFIDYFPDAIAAVAELSRVGNDQHNPGKPLFWDRTKSTDEADCLMRHFVERGTIDTDGVRHSAKVAWRALALLQKEIEAARKV